MRKRKTISKAVRSQVLNRFNGLCGYCGNKPDKLQVDHIIPHARGYQYERKGIDLDDISNLMPACARCNNYKISYSLEEFRTMIGRSIELARKNCVNFRNAERFALITISPMEKIVFYFEKHTENT